MQDITKIKTENQDLREGAFRKGDCLLQHSEVSERRLRRAWTKDTEEWMELGTTQGMRLAMNRQLCRDLAYQMPPPRTAGSNRQRGSQSPEGVILAGVQHGEVQHVSPLHQLSIKPPIHLPTENF